MSSLSPLEILHNAFRETLHCGGTYALVPQFLSNAEAYLKGGVITKPSAFSRLHEVACCFVERLAGGA
jgi:hypothetical protein